MIRWLLIIIMFAAGVGALVSGHDLAQRNPETLFLSEKGLADYLSFTHSFNEKKSLVIKKATVDEHLFFKQVERLKKLCSGNCEIITSRAIQKNYKSSAPIHGR